MSILRVQMTGPVTAAQVTEYYQAIETGLRTITTQPEIELVVTTSHLDPGDPPSPGRHARDSGG